MLGKLSSAMFEKVLAKNTQMNLYQKGVILGIIICILLYIYHSKSNDKNSGYRNRNDILDSKFKRYITRTVLISIGWLLIVSNSESVTTTVTYPLIILSSMFLVFAQYMRTAYIKLKYFISYLKIKKS
ncbi:hypothetical protein JOC73_002995 [Alkaliphilus hydrothermalis]|uniref:Uncharacterized protein n=1 Tax=Alkaliphilus hydrothermalis TaxID=1482730 RepID=A0ABS2NUG0_9FIRM|nr:hypothetical protein [Alkaliphilus hydrothermalis]